MVKIGIHLRKLLIAKLKPGYLFFGTPLYLSRVIKLGIFRSSYLYKSLVRPHLEVGIYCWLEWNPQCVKDKILLERVQHRYTRMLLELKALLYTERLRKLGYGHLRSDAAGPTYLNSSRWSMVFHVFPALSSLSGLKTALLVDMEIGNCAIDIPVTSVTDIRRRFSPALH